MKEEGKERKEGVVIAIRVTGLVSQGPSARAKVESVPWRTGTC